METLQRTANRGSVSTGYDIGNSYKNENDNAEKMTHTYDSAPTSQKKGTISMWFKRTEISSNIGLFQFGDDASGNYLALRWGRDIYGSLETYGMRIGGTNFSVGNTYGAVRDMSSFYHVVIAIDTTQATATNRFKVYRNGVELEWSTDNRSSITQDADLAIGENGKDVMIGEGVYKYNGYIAEVNYVDGQQLTSTDFGEYDSDSGIWIPKKYTGTYGNNGFYLDFSNASNLGEDQSGNNHDFTLTNITAADQATDTPTNNFCTWNPLWVYASQPVISEGATKVRYGDSTDEGAKATIGLTNGKWYWEAKPVGTIGSQYIGIQTDGDSNISSGANSFQNNYTMVINPTGRYYSYSDSQSESADQGFDLTTSDWLGIALDMDSSTQTIKYYKNGSLFLTRDLISNMQGKTVFPFLMNYENRSWDINFGGYTINTISSAASDANGYGTFEYAPPSGYYALCTKNLAEYG